MKRWRAPRAKQGQLKAQWGKLPHDSPDLIFVWGEGVPRVDGRLLYHALTRQDYSVATKEWYPGFVEQLEKRGYDLTTLKFSISKKSTQETST